MDLYMKQFDQVLRQKLKKYEVLRDMDLFVLDNSIRESTVGQLRGHTSADKWRILDEVKKCGFTDTIVASFSQDLNVDDDFIEELALNKEDMSGLYAFSEITTAVTNGMPDTKRLPVGLEKLKRVGMGNVILEIDLGDSVYNFEKFPIENLCHLLLKLVTWCHDNLHEHSKVLVNFRDMPDAMATDPSRVFHVVDFLAKLPRRLCLFGLMFEDPRGTCLPEECASWARVIRNVMDDNDWRGHLLVHIHEKFCVGDYTVLEVLMNGANGIWASVSHEGAAVGHAASIITLINLIRLGNKKVQQRYNCTYLRTAAINVTKITTGHVPPIKQPVYGEHALDYVLDLRKDDFDMADFFGEKAPVRISSVSSSKMIRRRLADVFGSDKQFTVEMGDKMKKLMLKDLREHRKEEYMSKHGLAMLFCRSGGFLTLTMRDILSERDVETAHARTIIKQIRGKWNSCCLQNGTTNADLLPYESFYSNFMEPYFAGYRCLDTRKALKALDVDKNGYIDWVEFQVYLNWALREYPDVENVDDVTDIVFRKGLIPVMRHEFLKIEKSELRKNDKENSQTKVRKNKLNTDSFNLSQTKIISQTKIERKPFLPKIKA